jgi:hypothetical protein
MVMACFRVLINAESSEGRLIEKNGGSVVRYHEFFKSPNISVSGRLI